MVSSNILNYLKYINTIVGTTELVVVGTVSLCAHGKLTYFHCIGIDPSGFRKYRALSRRGSRTCSVDRGGTFLSNYRARPR
jgi:hypothetical protein